MTAKTVAVIREPVQVNIVFHPGASPLPSSGMSKNLRVRHRETTIPLSVNTTGDQSMAATIVEKIFSKKCGSEIRAGDVVMAPLDGTMIHDITGPLAIQKFYEMGGSKVFDPERVIMLFDHQIPADSIEAANNHVYMRKFAAEQDILNYDINEGVCHQVTLEKGRAAPGEIVVGADSHTCMYGAVGAFATGIGSTDMGFALKFGALYFRVPETIRAEVTGQIPETGRGKGPDPLDCGRYRCRRGDL